jgi:hypothetical protein
MRRNVGGRNRRQLRAETWAWARRQGAWFWTYPAGLVGLAIALSLAPVHPFFQGFFAGAVLIFVVLAAPLLAVTGAGQIHRYWGSSGERATASELGSRRRRRQGWWSIHGLVLGDTEIDHIAVGPGGVLAIETKWTNVPWKLADDHLIGPPGNPLAQARVGAHQVRAFFDSATGGRLIVPVTPVLLVWGPGCPAVPGGSSFIGGVEVYSARDLKSFQARLDRVVLRPEEWEAAQQSLESFARRQLLSRRA